jgi:type IV pilus assembly protein PilB
MEAAELPEPLPAAALKRPGSRLHLGALLLRNKLLTAEQLEEALDEKDETGVRLGEIVARRGWVSGRALAHALAEQHELEYIDLGETEIEAAASALLPARFARRYAALPIRFLGEDAVLVAVADPSNVLTSDELRLALGVNVRFAVAAADDIEEMIGRIYRTDVKVGDRGSEPESREETRADDDREGEAATSVPAIELVNSILSRAIQDGASDIHFEPQADQLVVRTRIDGVMRRVTEVPASMQAAVTGRLKILGDLDIAEKRAPQDGRVSIHYGGEPMDLRIAVLPTTQGEQIVLRILARKGGGLGLRELGMNTEAEAAFLRAIRQPYGAVIACGPTGSGKTTTLYAALDLLNEEGRVLMTIEDPVEYQIPGVNQIEVHARSGLTFTRGLSTILRSDPDVLLVGEIRSEETARIAMTAAMTGRLVLTTLHTHNAASSIARLKDMGVDSGVLAASINCIVAQRLARRLCVACREPHRVTQAEREELGIEELADDVSLYRAKGCVQCAGTGYRGRVALYEVMPLQGRTRLMEASTEEILAAAVDQGMSTFRQEGMRRCAAGVTTLDEIRRVTGDRLF